MTRVIRLAAVAAAAAVATLGISGCGVAGNQLRPGVAADVEGTTISTADVDDVTDGYCSYAAANADPSQGVSAVPRAYFRGQVLGLLVQEQAMRDLLREQHVSMPSSLDSQIDGYAEQAFPGSHGEQRVGTDAISRAVSYLNIGIGVLGQSLLRAEGQTAAQGTDASRRGAQELTSWLTSHDITFNPRFGLTIDENGAVTYVDDDTSVAVSSVARSSQLSDLVDIGVSGASEEQKAYYATLPSNQSCG